MPDTSISGRIGVLRGVIEYESVVTQAALAKPRTNSARIEFTTRAALLHQALQSLGQAEQFLDAHDQEAARRHWRSTLAVMAEVYKIDVR